MFYLPPHAARHDPLVGQFARGLRELSDDPLDWLERADDRRRERIRERLEGVSDRRLTLRRLGAGALGLVLTVLGMAGLVALLEALRA